MRRLEPKKGNIIVNLGLLAFAIVGMIFACDRSKVRGNASHESPLAVELDDTLRVGIQISPMGVSTAGADTIGGFGYEMVNGIAKANNLALQIEGFTQVSDALKRLADNRYDIVISGVPVTSELRSDFLFTVPVYTDHQVLVQRKDSATGKAPITSQKELRGATVYLAAHSPFLQRVRNLSHEIGDTIYVVQDNEYGPEQLIILTALGEIPNVIANQRTAAALAKQYPDLDISLDMSFNQLQAWAVAPRDSLLRDSLDSYINRYKLTEEYNEILGKYF